VFVNQLLEQCEQLGHQSVPSSGVVRQPNHTINNKKTGRIDAARVATAFGLKAALTRRGRFIA
jgi:hypothetical protein